MRPFLLVLAITASAAADPTCDPDAPVGDRDSLVGHYMCQLTQDGKASDAYPCEIVAGNNYPGYLRTAKLAVACSVSGMIRKGGFEGSMSCDPAGPYLWSSAELATKFRAIRGGFVVEQKTDLVRTRPVGPNDTSIPRPTVDDTEHVALSLTVCRKPWPKGFKNEIAELEEKCANRPC